PFVKDCSYSAPFSLRLRPPSGSAILILLLVVLTTSKPAAVSATENELARRQEELLWKLVKGRILYPSLTALCVTGGIFLASW
ncbi:hypothetical protein ACSLNR_28445, partial [Escherichia coli]